MVCDSCVYWNGKDRKVYIWGNNRREKPCNRKEGYERMIIKGTGLCRLHKFHTMCFEVCLKYKYKGFD